MTSRLDRFEIQAEIGRGGFGQVFRAFDPVMNRVVAVKVLTATEDASSFNRFRNEATAAGNLHHENIVTVYEFGQEGKTPFIVMEYLDGNDLLHIIRNNIQLSLYQKIRIMDYVASGLHCAHRSGVVHRDVKPANIMVLKNGTVKIMDFGIARLTRDTSTRLTQQGYLIGTVVYMAPELFVGNEVEVDSVCDIWSYGVILYELLAGKNPFQTGSMPSEMKRILDEDPAPLPSKDCPPELQAVISKLLCKQRDFRYQTLEDTRFDLQPILKNLEKAEADRLLSNAQQLMFQQQWNEALDAARKAREMDPQNGTARIIFERAHSELRRASVRPRIDDLLRRSNDVAEQRKISEAIDLLDAARKLDTTNEKVLGRLQELRMIKMRLEEAANLVSEAGKEFRDKRLTAAFEHISEAVSLDPDNPEAKKLLENIQSEIQARDAERALEAEIRRARGLMAIDDLDGAMKTLKAAEANYPGRNETKELLARLTQLITERERRRDLARRLEHAKNTVREARFEEAVRELESLLASFPNEVEATDLLAYARQELRAKERSEEVKRITDAAIEFNRARRYADSIRILEEGLKKYPDDLPLTRLLRSTHTDNQNFERERALQAGLKRCETLRQGEHWQEALDLIGRLISDNQNNRELIDLEAKIREEKSQRERAAAIRSAVDEAEGLLGAGKPDSAVTAIEAAILAIGAERELMLLLDKAKSAQQVERERQYIESELKHAKGFEQRGDVTTSLKIIDDALLRSPQSAELLKARERLSSDREKAIRERDVSLGTSAVREALSRKEYAKAREKLEEVTRLFPTERRLSNLDEELRDSESDHINQQVLEGRRLLDAGQVAEAEQFCLANLRDHREIPEVIALVQAIQDEKRRRKAAEAEEAQRVAVVADCLRTAREREQKGDLTGALEAIQKGLKRYPHEPDLIGAQKRTIAQIATARQNQLFAAIRQALDRSNWSQAIPLIEQARQEYPDDPALIPLQDQALNQRRTFLESGAAAIRRLLGENKLDDARTLFDQNLARYPDQSIVRAVAEEIAGAQARRDEEERKHAFIVENLNQAKNCEGRGDSAGAVVILQKALKKYPADPELSAALNRLEDAIAREKRKLTEAGKISGIRKALDRSNWEDALRQLDEFRGKVVENPAELTSLETQAREQREREIQGSADKAYASLKLGNLAEAEKILTKKLAPFAGERVVADLAAQINQEKVRQNLIQAAHSHTAARRFDEADAAINELAARSPRDPEEGRLRSALDAAREQERKEKLYRTGRAEADQLLRNRQYDQAIAGFEYLLTQFPGDRTLQQDLAGANEARKRHQQPTKPAPAIEEPVQPHPPRLPRGLLYAILGTAIVAVTFLAVWLLRPPAHLKDVDVSPTVLTFQLQPGTSVEPQPVTVTSSSLVETPTASENWVKVTRGSSSAGKTEFLVSVLPHGIGPGGHDADITFPPSQKKVHVTLTVAAASFDPPSLTFVPNPRGSIQPQSIVVTSALKIPDPKPTASWVGVTRHEIGPGKTEFKVEVSPKGIADGGSADLVFTPDSKVHIAIASSKPSEKTSENQAEIRVQPPSLRFPDPQGSMQQQRVTVTGPSNGMNPVISSGWVRYRRLDLAPGRTEFWIYPSLEGLTPGLKTSAELTFGDKRVHIDLTVPDFSIQPATLNFPGPGGSMQAQRFIVSSPSRISDPQNIAPWIGLSRKDSPGKAEFTVSVFPEKAAAGKLNTADLTFAADRKVHVSLTLPAAVEQHELHFTPTDLHFTWTRGSRTPDTKSLEVTGAPEVPEPAHTQPWLQVTRTSATNARTEFSVQFLPDKVDADIFKDNYTDDLTFQQKKVHVDVAVKIQLERGSPHGNPSWDGGTLMPNTDLISRGRTVKNGNGAWHGDLRMQNLRVTPVAPGIKVVEQPNQANNFTLRLRNESGSPITSIEINWEAN